MRTRLARVEKGRQCHRKEPVSLGSATCGGGGRKGDEERPMTPERHPPGKAGPHGMWRNQTQGDRISEIPGKGEETFSAIFKIPRSAASFLIKLVTNHQEGSWGALASQLSRSLTGPPGLWTPSYILLNQPGKLVRGGAQRDGGRDGGTVGERGRGEKGVGETEEDKGG